MKFVFPSTNLIYIYFSSKTIDTKKQPASSNQKDHGRINLNIFLTTSQQHSQDGDCISDLDNEKEPAPIEVSTFYFIQLNI